LLPLQKEILDFLHTGIVFHFFFQAQEVRVQFGVQFLVISVVDLIFADQVFNRRDRSAHHQTSRGIELAVGPKEKLYQVLGVESEVLILEDAFFHLAEHFVEDLSVASGSRIRIVHA
jgi:hypothetical protein